MKNKVPKKNISPVLVDVKKPNYDYTRLHKFETVNLGGIPRAPKKVSKKTKRFAWSVATSFVAVILAFLAITFFNLNEAKFILAEGAKTVVDNFSSSVEALKEFRPDKAVNSLKKNGKDLDSLRFVFKKSYGETLFQLLGGAVPAFKDAGGLIEKVSDLNSDLILLSETISDLQTNGFMYFQSDGERLIRSIMEIRGRVGSATEKIESLRNSVSTLTSISPFFEKFETVLSENYLKYGSELRDLDMFLGGMLDFLKSDERHMLIFFQNIAEMRPGGGFIGSYADIAIRNGQMQSIDVRDIYDPDGQLDLKIVPPHEIKTMSRDWGARDANWFFDFPTSAKTVTYFLEKSKIYSEKNTTFDVAIGLNLNVVKSILEVIGPIPLEEYKIIIDSDTFFKEIQREVEAGKDKIAGEPKRILKVLAPIMLERLKILSEPQLRDLADRVGKHFSAKDVMVYAKDQNIQHYVELVNADGGVFKLPNNFWGLYLGVANANIAGGKTDVFMEQSIEANIDIATNGGIFTDMRITRAHTGDKEKDPWWRAENKNFIQVFSNPNAELVSIKGNSVKNLVSSFDYESNGYETLPQLQSIEKSKISIKAYQSWVMQAFGKSVFATWFNVPAGKTKDLDVRFQIPGGERTSATQGKAFTFVFDKQSGVGGRLSLLVSAPLGYMWEESESPIFKYENDNLSSRTILHLTLKKQ